MSGAATHQSRRDSMGSPAATEPGERWPRLAVTVVVALTIAAQLYAGVSMIVSTDLPYNALNARGYVIANAALLGVTALLLWWLPARLRALAVVPAAGQLALVLGGSFVLGGHWGSALAAVLTATAGWAVGTRLLARLGSQLTGLALVELVLGAGLLCVLIFLQGRASVISWWATGLPVMALGILGAIDLARGTDLRAGAARVAAADRIDLMLLALVCAQFTWIVVYLSAPDFGPDALYDKTYLSDLWARTGEMRTVLLHPVINLGGFGQVIAVPGLTLHAEDTGRWLQALALLGLVAAAWRRAGSDPRARALPAAGLLVTPMLFWEATTGYDDLLLGVCAAALAVAALRIAREQRLSMTDAALLGALGGVAVATKAHMAPYAAVIILGSLLSVRPWAIGAAVRGAGLALAGGVAAAGLPMLARWIDTGNPVFPAMNALFKSPDFPPVNEPYNFPYWKEAGPLDWLTLPARAALESPAASTMAPAGAYLVLLPAIILAFVLALSRRRPRGAVIVLAAIAVALFMWWHELRSLRYCLPYGVAAAFLVAECSRRGIWRPRVSAAVVVATLGLVGAITLPTGFAMTASPDAQPSLKAAFGMWKPFDYERRTRTQADVLRAFLRTAPPGAAAISQTGERLWVPGRDLAVWWELPMVDRARRGMDASLPGVAELRALGVQWMIEDIADSQTSDGTEPVRAWWLGLIRDHTDVVFADRGWALRRLVETPARLRAVGCDPRVTRTACWGAGIDDTPGIAPGETATRQVATCPGQTLSVRADLPDGSTGATVTIDANGPDQIGGFVQLEVKPATNRSVEATMPGGTTAAAITVDGTASRVTVSAVGGCPGATAPGEGAAR